MNNFHTFFDQFPLTFVQKGEIILHQGDVPKHAYAIKSGVIKISNITGNGEEKALSFKLSGDIIPIYWIFGQADTTLYFHQAHTDCELYVIDRDSMLAYIEQNQQFSKYIFDKLITAELNRELHVEALEQSRANLKLLYTFRHLALMHGNEIKKGLVRIGIPLTQQEIANFTGLTRETTVLELNKLRRQLLIYREHKHYTVDTLRINDFIDDEYNPLRMAV